MNKKVGAIFVLLILVNSSIVSATIPAPSLPVLPSSSKKTCFNLDLKNNLKRGDTDKTKNGEVTKLQKYLKANMSPSLVVTGVYDEATIKSVVSFQKTQSLSLSGAVATGTRGKLAIFCEKKTESKPATIVKSEDNLRLGAVPEDIQARFDAEAASSSKLQQESDPILKAIGGSKTSSFMVFDSNENLSSKFSAYLIGGRVIHAVRDIAPADTKWGLFSDGSRLSDTEDYIESAGKVSYSSCPKIDSTGQVACGIYVGDKKIDSVNGYLTIVNTGGRVAYVKGDGARGTSIFMNGSKFFTNPSGGIWNLVDISGKIAFQTTELSANYSVTTNSIYVEKDKILSTSDGVSSLGKASGKIAYVLKNKDGYSLYVGNKKINSSKGEIIIIDTEGLGGKVAYFISAEGAQSYKKPKTLYIDEAKISEMPPQVYFSYKEIARKFYYVTCGSENGKSTGCSLYEEGKLIVSSPKTIVIADIGGKLAYSNDGVLTIGDKTTTLEGVALQLGAIRGKPVYTIYNKASKKFALYYDGKFVKEESRFWFPVSFSNHDMGRHEAGVFDTKASANWLISGDAYTDSVGNRRVLLTGYTFK